MSVTNVPTELKAQLKQQRLRNLQAMWYERQLNKVACEAQGATQQAALEQAEMDKLALAYDAVEAFEE
ncbi:hypothetical protein [Paenibacillus koleovorans]|uniref:hypothetical protein n=1 Tax=Paenibacillus koleovorans TaxID=121608 RepID=UPI000FDBDD74|nr:hypothetical protein [Paenibacillus koleovorans]